MWCNGSHGSSVGSLGQVRIIPAGLVRASLTGGMQYAGETDIVANVFVNNVTMRNAENGARIKVFGGSPYASTSLHPAFVELLLTGTQTALREAAPDT